MRFPLVSAVVLLAFLAGSTSARSASAGTPVGTFSGCPRDLRPLPARLVTSEARLRRAVLQFVGTAFRHVSQTPPRRLVGARVIDMFLVRNWLPSGWVKQECGATVWRRSVGAVVYFPLLDKPHNPVGRCNDCARITFLAALTRGGWTVWGDF